MKHSLAPLFLGALLSVQTSSCNPEQLQLPDPEFIEGQWGGESAELHGDSQKLITYIGCETATFPAPAIVVVNDSFQAAGVISAATFAYMVGLNAKIWGRATKDTVQFHYAIQDHQGRWVTQGFHVKENGAEVLTQTYTTTPGKKGTYSLGLFCPV